MNTPLTIALVSTERKWQGGEEQAYQLARGLRARGHHVLAIGLAQRPWLDRMRRDRFETFPLTGKPPTPYRCWMLRRFLQRSRVDVVHFNDAHALTLGGIAAWRLPGVARIAARRASFAIRSPARYRHLCDRVLCVSSYAASLCRLAGVPESHLRIVHDGVDPQRVAQGDRKRGRQTLALAPATPCILAIGSLAPSKGHRFLIEAVPRLVAKRPDLCVAIAGEGPLHEQLQQLARRLGVEPVVRLLGFRTDIPDLIHACDLFVFPSIQEGLGSTLIDVMLAERPIVTTTSGGIPDLVFDQNERPLAHTVPAGRADELAVAIADVLDHRTQYLPRTRRARQHALARFTVDSMVEHTLRCYHEVLNEKKHDTETLPAAG